MLLVFVLGNLPLPLILYLNWRVTLRFIRVRKLSKNVPVAKPKRLIIGWVFTNVATVFALIPPISERQIFVQNPKWLWLYALSAAFTITGLLLMNSALGLELSELASPGGRTIPRKPVDTSPSDTL